MPSLKKILLIFTKPWLHFLLAGIILNNLSEYLFPPPMPVVGPISEERIDVLRKQWIGMTRIAPSPAQLDSMIRSELDRDLMFHFALSRDLHLFDPVVYQRLLRNMAFMQLTQGRPSEVVYQDAIDMRLYLSDEVIKRRMIQVVEQILVAKNPPSLPTDQEVSHAFQERKKEFRHPTKFSLEHVYFPKTRAEAIDDSLTSIVRDNMLPSEARQFSSPFLPGYKFVAQSGEQLARRFGEDFVTNLQALQPEVERWIGPVGSTYGQHLVWISRIEAGREARLPEVRKELIRSLRSDAYKQVLAAELAKLRLNYEIRR